VLLARVNTVSRTMLQETQATGNVSDHPPADAPLKLVLDDPADAFQPWQGRPTVRVAIVHHPPHPFRIADGDSLKTALLEGAAELAERLADLGVQLVIAGHRHRLDPPRHPPAGRPPAQEPLRTPPVQLVAQSPTPDTLVPVGDRGDYAGLQGLSFSRYRLLADDAGSSVTPTFSLQRTVFSFQDADDGFSHRTSTTRVSASRTSLLAPSISTCSSDSSRSPCSTKR